MTPHECHMLKINVQLCILLLLHHFFSSVYIGPYNCFFSSMNKSKLNLKLYLVKTEDKFRLCIPNRLCPNCELLL